MVTRRESALDEYIKWAIVKIKIVGLVGKMMVLVVLKKGAKPPFSYFLSCGLGIV